MKEQEEEFRKECERIRIGLERLLKAVLALIALHPEIRYHLDPESFEFVDAWAKKEGVK